MKTFEIWSEGFWATGMEGTSGTATRHGESKGDSFKEACNNLAKSDVGFRAYYDPKKLTYWGSRLFDNESEARKRFG